jgi:hypothetical protein
MDEKKSILGPACPLASPAAENPSQQCRYWARPCRVLNPLAAVSKNLGATLLASPNYLRFDGEDLAGEPRYLKLATAKPPCFGLK